MLCFDFGPIVYRLGHQVFLPHTNFNGPIVYRLGHQVFILKRGVRLPLGLQAQNWCGASPEKRGSTPLGATYGTAWSKHLSIFASVWLLVDGTTDDY